METLEIKSGYNEINKRRLHRRASASATTKAQYKGEEDEEAGNLWRCAATRLKEIKDVQPSYGRLRE